MGVIYENSTDRQERPGWFELQRALAPLGEVVAVDQHECDLSNPDAIRQLVAKVAPQEIINPPA